uniref:hypothetical protein n=1 Tax=Staphylococcus saprophyticus TaxID=29385 RepID=UPI001C92D4F5
FNNLFPYFIQITTPNLQPFHPTQFPYHTNQTLSDPQPFITHQLKHKQHIILPPQHKPIQLQYQFFLQLTQQI